MGPRGGMPGSLYVAVHVAPHPALQREGTELYFEAELSIAQAALGTKIQVPTVEGEDTEVEIKPGTQPGTEIRLRGRGAPHLRRQSVRGDLHVIANVTVPTRLTKRQRELLEQYAAVRDQQGLPDGALAGLAADAVRGSAAPDELQRELLDGIDAWLASA